MSKLTIPQRIVRMEKELGKSKSFRESWKLARKIAKLYQKTIVCPQCDGVGLIEAKKSRRKGAER